MVPPLRRLLVGQAHTSAQRALDLLLALTLFGATLAAYALGVFGVTGGVVFVPGDAAVVGLLGAAVVAYRRSGLAFAWIAAYGALLGYRADHAFLGLSSRSFTGQLAYFLELEGLGVLAAEALVIGTLGFVGGALAVRGVDAVRRRRAVSQPD